MTSLECAPEFPCVTKQMAPSSDMENIKDSMDLRADDNGAWLHNGLQCVWVSVCKNKVEILSRKKQKKAEKSVLNVG